MNRDTLNDIKAYATIIFLVGAIAAGLSHHAVWMVVLFVVTVLAGLSIDTSDNAKEYTPPRRRHETWGEELARVDAEIAGNWEKAGRVPGFFSTICGFGLNG